MKFLRSVVVFMALFACMQNDIYAAQINAKRHKSSSSSSSNRASKLCKNNKKMLQRINNTVRQDLVVDTTTLQVVNQIKQTVSADLAIDKEILADVQQLIDCSCTCTVIKPSDFLDENGVASVPYIITEPGNYCLGGDVAFDPPDAFFSAIVILANNVQLDLRGFTLSQANNSDTNPAALAPVYGVQIGEGYFYNNQDLVLENITIKNGTISTFSGAGIFCINNTLGDAFGDPATTQEPFKDLQFLDLNILKCGPLGGFDAVNVALDSASGIDLDCFDAFISASSNGPVGFDGVKIENCHVNECVGYAAINVFTGSNIVVSNTTANDLQLYYDQYQLPNHVIEEGGAFAHRYYGRNIKLSNLQGNGSSDLDPFTLTTQCGGISCEGSLNITIRDSQFNDAFGASSAEVNNNLSLNTNALYENCQFNNLRGGRRARTINCVHGSSALIAPLEGSGVKWINCQFNGASVDPENIEVGVVGGFLNTCMKNMVFENCQSVNHQSAGTNLQKSVLVAGFFSVADESDVPGARFGDSSNTVFRNCIVSDISGTSGGVYGFFVGGTADAAEGEQLVRRNIVLENCIAERISSTASDQDVAGIAVCTVRGGEQAWPKFLDVFIQGCRVSDVRSNGESVSLTSAGILLSAVTRPVVQQNSVSDCDRGILLTGTDSITPSNCFQLALTPEDALAESPIPIILDPTPVEVSTDQAGLGPFVVLPQQSANPADLPISMKEGAVASPDISACTTNIGDMTGKIGINIRSNACTSTVYPNNMANAGAVATITGFTPETVFTAPGALVYGVVLDVDDTNALISAINSNPSLLLTIDTNPSATGLQTFNNTNQANSVTTTPSLLQQGTGFICSATDLNTLGWQSGDSIVYNNNGNANLSPLVSGTTYYAIVYIPGFSSNGFIQDNEIDNCSISCYQDDADTTSSAWVNNTAFNCGAVPTQFTNYDISFAGVRPVDSGTLVTYPVGGNKYYNLSLVP